LRARTLRNLRIVSVVVVLSAGFGVFLAGLTPFGITTGILIGGVNGLLLASFEISLRYRWADAIRRLPVTLTFLFRTGVYGIVLLGVPYATGVLVHPWAPASLGATGLLANLNLPLSLGFVIAINLAFMMSGLLGPRVLTSLITGRYHHPQEEQRIVLFLDLVGSTRLAEILGDKKFHRFLNQVFFDITDPVLEAGGEIYRYVGDEIIITWPLERGARDAACLACVLAAEDALERRRDEYRAAFGAEPTLRAALHVGPVIVGEMGDIKREIVMLGDTMNTTARIENVCRSTKRDCIASAALVRQLSALPAGVRAESLGPIALSGKESGVELFEVLRD